MFGLGFGEMVVLGIVLLVVVGPRELPKLLKSVGRGISKLRAMSADLREQSGIDDILEEEGLREDLQTIRSLSRGRVVDGLVGGAMAAPRRKPNRPRMSVKALEDLKAPDGEAPPMEDEWPTVGEDAAGALPDDASEDELAAARAAREASAKADAEEGDGDDDGDAPTSGERELAKAEGAS